MREQLWSRVLGIMELTAAISTKTYHPVPLLVGAALIMLTGCASVPVGEAAAISARIEQATGARPNFTEANALDVTARIDALLAEPLTPEVAAQIAIASNPRVQMAFAQLGIARADFMDGALPANPMIHAARLAPKALEADMLTYGFGFDLLSLLTLPARRSAAAGGWEAAKARAVGETLMVAGNARLAMIDYIAANQNLDLMRQANEASGAALVAAEAIFAAGNSPQMDVDRERLFAGEMAIALKQAQANLVPARERVNVALGLSASQRANWSAIARLPAPPNEAITVDTIESDVVAASTDLAVATGLLRAAKAMRGVSGISSILPELELSGERERDDGVWKRGFGLGVGLPIFGLGGANRLRAQSQAQLAQASLTSLDQEIRAQARSDATIAEATRQIAIERREIMLPLSAQVFSGAQLNFNAMQMGIFQLLEAKRVRLDAGRASINATRDYWIARANLDLLRQGSRGAAASMLATSDMPKPAAGH
jgi:outer membrane protein, heavy metal efflux system